MAQQLTREEERQQREQISAREAELRAVGRAAAAAWQPVASTARLSDPLRRRAKTAYEQVKAITQAPATRETTRAWLIENARLIRTAVKESEGLSARGSLRVAVHDPAHGATLPRTYAAARTYLTAVGERFEAQELASFVRGLQDSSELEMGELWGLKPVLQLVLLERLAAIDGPDGERHVPVLIASLQAIGQADWKLLFESMNVVDPVLRADPIGAYARMDFESRDTYRKAIAEIAAHSDVSEREVAQIAVHLAEESQDLHGSAGRAQMRRAHIGFYLIDAGLHRLKRRARYVTPPFQRLRDFVRRYPTGFYLLGIEILTFLITVFLLQGLEAATLVAGFFLILMPATQAAVDFMNNLTSYLLRPRSLPKLDFSEGIPDDCATMVAVPTLLLRDGQVRELVNDLEIRYLANRDRNLTFALLTDWPDAPAERHENDSLLDLCVGLVDDLNRRYGDGGRTPFYLFHRHRTFNPKEGSWMGWERKRGKLLDLNQLLRGGFDSFPMKVGNPDIYRRVRYVITLDSDTQLPRDAARKLVGTLAHPLNAAVVDPRTNMVVEGYGILQPRIGISIQSASRSRLASIYSGQTGFDIYTRAISDVYQDLFAEGIFTGKGIYEVDVLRTVLERRFPDNQLLSHDLIEGAYARAGLVSDVEMIDDYPSHFSAYSRRKHRWVRGDWQILRWLFARVPNANNQLVPNPISLISRWKIADNVRRSLFDPFAVLLLLGGWFFLPGAAWKWTLVSVLLLLMPAYAQLFFALLRAPWRGPVFPWARETIRNAIKSHFVVFLQLVFLLHQALLSIDAIARSVMRQYFTKRKLLEWETAAEAESAQRRKSTVDIYLEWCPSIAVSIGVMLALVRPESLPAAAPILGLWFAARFYSARLNRAPKAPRRRLAQTQKQRLRLTALRTWRFFDEFSNAANNYLIPDNIREDGAAPAERCSPTNLGFLLDARVAAVHLGYIDLERFVELTEATLKTMEHIPRRYGHYVNWHDNMTLEPLEPQFISTVDSGNLIACLWTLRQAALAFSKGYENRWREGAGDMLALLHSLDSRFPQHAPGEAEKVRDTVWSVPQSDSAEVEYWRARLLERIASSEGGDHVGEEMRERLLRIADMADRLANDMDFSFLYHARKHVLSVGFDVNSNELAPSAYDLMASESRIACFGAIAKGDLPQDAWFHLGRKHTVARGQRVLLSWTGTMFEYLMPALWMRHYMDTLLQRTIVGAIRVQADAGARMGTPWGISESVFGREPRSGTYEYAAFGIGELAMKHAQPEAHVISPYSSFLALCADPGAAMANIDKMAKLGWTGEYGFIEAVDFGHNGAEEPVLHRMWMAHHQGMILLAIVNLVENSVVQNYFHAEPQVLATELLLHERVPPLLVVEQAEEAPVAMRRVVAGASS